MSVLNTVQARIAELDTEMATIKNAIEKEQRLLTADEADKLEKSQAEHTDLTRQSKLLNGVTATRAASSEPVRTVVPARSITGGRPWNHLGQWTEDVRRANHDASVRTRLMNAATVYGTEGTNADGGYAVPADLRRDIQSYVVKYAPLLPLTDQYDSFSNVLTFPLDVVQEFGGSGGTSPYSGTYIAEGAAYTETKPSLTQRSVTAAKLGTIINVTDELLQDSVAMGSFVSRKAGERIGSLITKNLISGSDSQWSGYLKAGAALKTVSSVWA
jgi:HK97 family phage major capsid protein